jgi:hypothetical protein
LNCQQAFKNWYEFMIIDRLKNRISLEQRGKAVETILGALQNDRASRLKQVVDKFRQHARITDIQRRFLTKILNSRAGKVFKAFMQIKDIPNNKDLSPGVYFYNKLLGFALRNVRDIFNKFKSEETEGMLRKRKAALLMIKNSISSNKKSLDKWHNFAMTAKMYERSKRVDQFMSTLNKIEVKHLSVIYYRRQFNFNEITHLHKLFVNFAENATKNLRFTLQTWRENAANQRKNPWFEKAARILALNSTINIQKSLWRFKQNMNEEGFPFTAPKIVKLKKMFNNIRKLYELVVAKSFWIVERVGRINPNGDSQDPLKSSFISSSNKDREKERSSVVVQHYETSIVENVEAQIKLENIVSQHRKIAVTMMDKIFKRGLSKSMKKWAFFTLPAKRLEFAYKEIDKATPLYNSVFVSRVGAIDHFSHLTDQIRFRSKAFAFKKLI